jgi:hypothetical protein
MSPLYLAVMLSAPTGTELVVSEAVAPAKDPTPKKVLLPAVPETETALPS